MKEFWKHYFMCWVFAAIGWIFGFIFKEYVFGTPRIEYVNDLQKEHEKETDILWRLIEYREREGYYIGSLMYCMDREKRVILNNSHRKYRVKVDSLINELEILKGLKSEVHQTIPKKKEI